MLNFGNKLRTLRMSKGWTQEDLASRLQLTKSVVSAYETSLRYPSYDVLIRICSIFNVTSDYLLGMEKQRTVDISCLNDENRILVTRIIEALKEKQSDSK